MATRTPHIRTRTIVNSNGSLIIETYADRNSDGTILPSIYEANLLNGVKTVDGVSGREGQLLVSYDEGADVWLDENGNLLVSPAEGDNANEYSVDAPEGNLIYNHTYGPSVEPDNVLNELDDILDVHITSIVSGDVTLDDWEDDWENLDSDHRVERQCRTSVDGIFWSDWSSVDDILGKSFRVDRIFHIQIRYTRQGFADSVVLGFNSIWFSGDVVPREIVAPTLYGSIFAPFVGTPEQILLEENLFKKLYYRGIIPNYIDRGDNFSREEDEDYIVLFSAIAKFFSLIIVFAKSFEKIGDRFNTLLEWVRGLGIYFNEADVTLEELKYLANNYYSQIQQRGTAMIYSHKGDELPNGDVMPIDGELLRLFRSKKSSELLLGNVAVNKMGWCVRNSSPLYRGTCQGEAFNKTKEKTKDFQDLSNFPIFTEGNSEAEIISYQDRNVISLHGTTTGDVVGLGRPVGSNDDVSDFLITADPEISYEITIAFQIVSATLYEMKMYFGVEGFDENSNKLDDSFLNINGSVGDGQFWYQTPTIWKKGEWYYARGIIHSYGINPVTGTTTNLGIGNDIVFNNRFLRYICPRFYIECQNTQAQVVIWDYKVRPLVRGLSILGYRNGNEAQSHSLGFVQAANFMYTYARNNNNSQSQEEITDIIEKYLYPYGKINLFVLSGNR